MQFQVLDIFSGTHEIKFGSPRIHETPGQVQSEGKSREYAGQFYKIFKTRFRANPGFSPRQLTEQTQEKLLRADVFTCA